MKNLLFVIAAFVCLSTAPAYAVKVSSLYQAELPVASQATDARAQAIQDGFVQVLIKVSGDPQIDKNPDIKLLLKKADYYVQEYSYSLPSSSAAQYLLQINYNRNDINKLFKRSGVAYWGENRPLILVWLTVVNGEDPAEIVDNDTPNGILDVMKQQSKKIGLPLIFPMMDVADVNLVTPNDVSAMMLPVLKEAGKRYSPDALLVGNIKQLDDNYQSQWKLILGDNEWNWNINGKAADDVVNSVLGQVSQTFVKRYVVRASNTTQSWVKLQVSNVSERDDLNRLMQYLKQLPPVQRIELSQISGNMVELSVQVRGSLATFQQNALIGRQLVFKSQDEKSDKLIYEWMR